MSIRTSVIIVTALGVITLVAGLILYEFLGFDAGEYVTTVGLLLTAVAGFITVLVQLLKPAPAPTVPTVEQNRKDLP